MKLKAEELTVQAVALFLLFQLTSGLEQSITCERGRAYLSCPSGQVILIRSASFGRTERATCLSSWEETTSCESPLSELRMRQQCQYQQSCSIDASDATFGDPCVATFKYLNVTYDCETLGSSVRICEHQEEVLRCSPGSVLNVIAASFGRREGGTCGGGSSIQCSAPFALDLVKESCDGLESCTPLAEDQVFGDPCVGTLKYLDVLYNCQPKRTAVVCEGGELKLNCPLGLLIAVHRANYGRTERAACKTSAGTYPRCYEPFSTQLVSSRCSGKASCSVTASNELFGDPCPGTFKMLQASYSCL